MGACQSTEAGDGQAIPTARPATKYVDGLEPGHSKVDRNSVMTVAEGDVAVGGNDTYITALPNTTPGGTRVSTPTTNASPTQEPAAAKAPASEPTAAVPELDLPLDGGAVVADDEGGGGSGAEEDDYYTENSSDDGSYNTENSSDEDGGSYHTDNSSDGGEGSDDGDNASLNETPLLQLNSTTPDAASPTFQLAPFDKGGAAWTRGTKSFRVRMTNSRTLTPAVLKILLSSEKGAIDTEYDNIPVNNEKFDNLPRLTEAKNRYFNILPNAHSRIQLKKIGDDETSAYVNGNWMPGYEADKSYIACQGPLPDTIHDFWRMVWENSCATIVMNTGLIEGPTETVKCERYWPATPDGDPMVIGEGAQEVFKIVSVRESRPRPQFVQTLLEVQYQGETRQVTHLWWRDWPDKGVPKTANGIGHYIDAARASREESGGPVVIHCSAGVGRTGCFLGIDYCMKQFDAMKTIDILGCVCKLRQSRGLTVQTASQYRFIHMVMDRYMGGILYDDMPEPEKKPRRKSSRTAMAALDASTPTSPAGAGGADGAGAQSPAAASSDGGPVTPSSGGKTRRKSSHRKVTLADEGALPRSTSSSTFDVDGSIIVTAKLTPNGVLAAKPKRKSKRKPVGRKPMRAKNQSVQAIGPRPSWPPRGPDGNVLGPTISE